MTQLTTFPTKIHFKSDDTDIEFVKVINGLKETFGEYVFTKAKVNKGKTVTLALAQIQRLINDNLAEVK